MKMVINMERKPYVDRFFDALLTLKTREEFYDFFEDACTPKEVMAIAQRFAVAEMLNNKRVYADIVEETGASTATISRVSRSMNKGFKTVFERLQDEL